jgi:hypothetical protein
MKRTLQEDVESALENIADGGGTVEEHAKKLSEDHFISVAGATQLLNTAIRNDPYFQRMEAEDAREDDGPAGDFLNDYWFTAGGPDEPPEVE